MAPPQPWLKPLPMAPMEEPVPIMVAPTVQKIRKKPRLPPPVREAAALIFAAAGDPAHKDHKADPCDKAANKQWDVFGVQHSFISSLESFSSARRRVRSGRYGCQTFPPLRAGTVGSLSDNNFAVLNLPIFFPSVNSFLTFSAQIWIFGACYNFLFLVLSFPRKTNCPLQSIFRCRILKLEQGFTEKVTSPFQKATMLRLFLIVCNLLSCPTMPSQAPKVSASRAKATIGGAPAAEKGRTACSFQPSEPESAQFLFRYRNASPDIARYPNTSGVFRIPVRNTSEHFRRFPDLVRMPLRGPIYKERK